MGTPCYRQKSPEFHSRRRGDTFPGYLGIKGLDKALILIEILHICGILHILKLFVIYFILVVR
jgi:hypothetical protein